METMNTLDATNKVKFVDAQVYYEDGKPYLNYVGVLNNGYEVEIQRISLDDIRIDMKREEGLYLNSVECKILFKQDEDNGPIFFTVTKDAKKYSTGQEIKVKFSEEGTIYDMVIGRIEMNTLNDLSIEYKYELIFKNGPSLGFWREKHIEAMEVR